MFTHVPLMTKLNRTFKKNPTHFSKVTYSETNAVIREGWKILVEQLGIQKATEFVVLLERGKGDSVKEIANYWGDASIDEIHNQVILWKAKRQSTRDPIEPPDGV
jgi:hypothetical protein